MTDWTEHAAIYLSPWCAKCDKASKGAWLKGDGAIDREWCQEPQDPCEECGKPWVKFNLAPDDIPQYVKDAVRGAQVAPDEIG